MSSGLIALLDDIAGIAKMAAASLDDVVTQTGQASAKAAGVVIDDTAVTPRYVVGFAAERELPMIGKIALGSLKNKLLILLPAALLLSYFAPWVITPLLMIGGLYLSFEGAEKVYELLTHKSDTGDAAAVAPAVDAKTLEAQKVAGAIRTDFILSAEIMALTLAGVADKPLMIKAMVLLVTGLVLTAGVYGVVALIVKADDVGLALSRGDHSRPVQAIGRALVKGMPRFLKVLAGVGTAAMIWVGGGILLHGLEHYGVHSVEHVLHAAQAAVTGALGTWGGFTGWATEATISGVVGLIAGGLLIPIVGLFHKH